MSLTIVIIIVPHSIYSHSSDYGSYDYVDGCNTPIYTQEPQIPRGNDEDSNSKPL